MKLPDTFDDLQVGIVLHEPETGAILDVNERLERLYGYSRTALREMDISEYTAPSTAFTQEQAIRRIRAAADGDTQLFEWRIERDTGELVWVRVHLTLTTIDTDSYVIAEVRDITEYKARERRLRLLNRVVRHNLRNETNVLMGYADRLKRAIEEESLEEEIETILEIATELGTLSDSIRQIEEIAEPTATQRSPTNLGTMVRELVTEVQDAYPTVELTADIRTAVSVNVDQGLRYAIEHALINAIVHNDADTPSVEVLVTTNADRGVIRIADNGPPIPDVEIDVLKDDVTTSSTYHGSGVGLWVMQWCVDSLGGELSFETNPPRGNVVQFSLPRAAATDTEHASDDDPISSSNDLEPE
ncbi:PAS domain-containing sensor histidine kinase [Natronorubrum thiooxidans]|uniref:histidine kinase n=1 Tax=Natronorubrum thiooxidans TaxID=308853 RepID=A0A1N7C7R7_9EURY|nr:PAS domain-containing sensor histidine kinase [Natronorubrum thiooxidans]SIR59701.1 PAS domain S-box-containing protein [Natronorubrum thiooxidans]